MRKILGGTIALFALTGCAGASPGAAPPITATVTLPAVTETVPGPAQTTVTLPAKTVTVTAEPPAPVAAIEEGIWEVGTDIKPGTYRTIDPVSDCYWAIYRTGTNGGDIIANDTPSGGRPSVTLRKGQDFKTQNCGSWKRVG